MKTPKLGQHFLTRPEVARWVALAVAVPQSGVVLEIGPGQGILTRELLTVAKKVVAIEKDSKLFDELSENFKDEITSNRLILKNEDVRDFSPEQCNELQDGYALIANIPYYITGQIIRMFLTTEHQPESIAVLIQKEVAERIVARDGKQSLLSLSVALYGKPRIVRPVKAGAFSPPPKVDSAILAIEGISRTQIPDTKTEQRFFEIIRAAFVQKRKTLGSSLKKTIAEKTFLVCSIKKVTRPEDVLLGEWLCLAQQDQ